MVFIFDEAVMIWYNDARLLRRYASRNDEVEKYEKYNRLHN